jgi:hypothetical protein
MGIECYSLDATASHTWSFKVPNASEVALRVEGSSLAPGSLLSFTRRRNDTGTPETFSISASQLEAEGGEWEAGIALSDTVYLTLTTTGALLGAADQPDLKAKVKAKIPEPFYDLMVRQEAVINTGPFIPIQNANAQLKTNAEPVFKIYLPVKFTSSDTINNTKMNDLIKNGANGYCTGWNAASAGGNRNWAFTNWHCIPEKQGGGIPPTGKSFPFTDTDGKIKTINVANPGSVRDYDFAYRYQEGPPNKSAKNNAVVIHGAGAGDDNDKPHAIDQALDFSLLKINDNSKEGTKAVALIEVNGCTQDRQAHIPQHPAGDPKSVVTDSDNKGTLAKIIGVAGVDVTYNINTKPGSSGSPVYDTNSNKVCALHNAADNETANHGVNLKNIMNFKPVGKTQTIRQILGL